MHLTWVSKRAQRRLRVCVVLSSVISRGSSGRVLTKSVSRRAGAVVLPSSLISAGTILRMPTSRFVAVRANPSPVVSRRMLFKIGRVVRVEMARETTWRA